jgi:hypothetical protein
MKKALRVTRAQASSPEPAPGGGLSAAGAPQGGWRIAAYLISLPFPVIGLTLGVLFAGGREPGARRFGRICLLMAVLGFCLSGIYSALNTAVPESGEKFIENFY